MNSKSGVKISISLVILSLIINIASSQVVKNISNFRHYTYKDGLPENDVKEFIADSENGYWFRTSGGITFFNGYEFINYSKYNKIFHLENEKIFSFNIYQDHIYVFGNEGIDIINWKTKESRFIYTHHNPTQIRLGFITSKGNILIITSEGAVFELVKNQLKRIGSITYYSNCTISETLEGYILVSNENKEVIIFDSTLSLIKKYNGSFWLTPPGIFRHSSYGTIITTNKNNYRLDPKLRDLAKIDEGLSFNRLFCETDQYFFSVSKFNKILQQDKTSSSLTEVKILLNINYYINHISKDNHNAIVLCTNQGIVIFSETNNSFKQLPYPLNIKDADDNTRRALIETRDHKVLQVTYKSLAIYDPLSFTNKLISLTDYNGYSALLDGDILWIGTDGQGLISVNLKDASITGEKRFLGVGPDSFMHITALNKLNDQYLIIGTYISNVSLKLFDVKKHKFKNIVIRDWPGGVIRDKVSSIVDARGGGKWICTNSGLIHLTDSFELKRWIGNKELGTNLINYVYEDDSNNVWIATDHGLFVYNMSRHQIIKRFTYETGLAGNKCISIIPDKHQTIWVATYTGLSRIDLKSGSINNYYIHDGLSDNEYNYSSFLKLSSGDIYLGGLNNYVHISPYPFDFVKKSKVKLSMDYILLSKRGTDSLINHELTHPLKLHFKNDRLNITFSLKNQIFSEFISYKYRIKGLDQKWIFLNRNNSITVDYLPPGNYLLQIQSMDVRNKQNELLIELPISSYTYFYESTFFYILLVLFIIGLITTIFIIRFSSIKKIGRLKTDLSNDIHDEIGTIFTKAVMQLDLLNQKAGKAYPEITAIERSLRDGIQRFRNVLWSLNTDFGKSDDFASRINTTISEIFSDTAFDYRVTNKSVNVYFNKSIRVRRNLLLIIRELAHNTLKHSNGDFFEVIISKQSNKWILEIFDNGTNKTDTADSSKMGLGLKSIERRVASIKGKLLIENQPNCYYIKIII